MPKHPLMPKSDNYKDLLELNEVSAELYGMPYHALDFHKKMACHGIVLKKRVAAKEAR